MLQGEGQPSGCTVQMVKVLKLSRPRGSGRYKCLSPAGRVTATKTASHQKSLKDEHLLAKLKTAADRWRPGLRAERPRGFSFAGVGLALRGADGHSGLGAGGGTLRKTSHTELLMLLLSVF